MRRDDLPRFATDLQIGEVLFGKAKAALFVEIAPRLEAKGLPRADPLHDDRRYLPAVLRWYDVRYGVDSIVRVPGPQGEVGPWRYKRTSKLPPDGK